MIDLVLKPKTHQRKLKIYLAGFDVFLPDAKAAGVHLVKLCEEAGFEGLFPLDTEAPKNLSGPALAMWIYTANCQLIREADVVMANLNDFRGPGEADSGTAWELGFAAALCKPTFGYRHEMRPLIETVAALQDEHNQTTCKRGYLVEDFGLPVNLMLACSTTIVAGGPKDCLEKIASVDPTLLGDVWQPQPRSARWLK